MRIAGARGGRRAAAECRLVASLQIGDPRGPGRGREQRIERARLDRAVDGAASDLRGLRQRRQVGGLAERALDGRGLQDVLAEIAQFPFAALLVEADHILQRAHLRRRAEVREVGFQPGLELIEHQFESGAVRGFDSRQVLEIDGLRAGGAEGSLGLAEQTVDPGVQTPVVPEQADAGAAQRARVQVAGVVAAGPRRRFGCGVQRIASG